MGFWDEVKKQAELQKQNQKTISQRAAEKLEAEQSEKAKLKEYDAQGIPYCPKCHSTALSANKKGFGVGKAAVGAALTGGIGLLAGGIGANKIELTCMKCGHRFKPGK